MEEQLPPPPSSPLLKESGLDGVPRPDTVDKILYPDAHKVSLKQIKFSTFCQKLKTNKLKKN